MISILFEFDVVCEELWGVFSREADLWQMLQTLITSLKNQHCVCFTSPPPFIHILHHLNISAASSKSNPQPKTFQNFCFMAEFLMAEAIKCGLISSFTIDCHKLFHYIHSLHTVKTFISEFINCKSELLITENMPLLSVNILWLQNELMFFIQWENIIFVFANVMFTFNMIVNFLLFFSSMYQIYVLHWVLWYIIMKILFI